MVAEDHAHDTQTASLLYKNIRILLTNNSNSTNTIDHKLPLVYVIDSILKNVGGEFIPIVEKDAITWIPIVHNIFSTRPDYRLKLKKVLSTWSTSNIFKQTTIQKMYTCFDKEDTEQALAVAKAKQAENTLQNLSVSVKNEMNNLLNDLYKNENELDKLSLERLVVVNPNLFNQIKSTAEGILKTKQQSNNATSSSSSSPQDKLDATITQNIFIENRPNELIHMSRDWATKTDFAMNDVHKLISNLQSFVRDGSLNTTPSSSPSISLLASASSTANHLTTLLQKQKEQQKSTSNGTITSTTTASFLKIDKSLFTTEGLSKMSHTYIVAKLYHQGLPYLSSADGRRFASQLELSYHLDKLFQKNQIDKTMERKEERGWYTSTSEWTLVGGTNTNTSASNNTNSQSQQEQNKVEQNNTIDQKPVNQILFIADEERSKCRICSINFDMIFDNSSSVFMYKNCIEMYVEGTDEKVLVHESCRRNLGCLDYLTLDQII